MKEKNLTKKKNELTIVREFSAPKDLVFGAFANAKALAEWWGPAGMPVTVVSFDFKPNGKFHYKMEGQGKVMWGLFVYRNILSPDLIEFVSSFSDEHGNIAKAPFEIDFPAEIFNKITFEEKNGITKITLQGHPLNATEAQETTYNTMHENMQQGFNGTFNQLEQYIKAQLELRKKLKTTNKARTSTYLNFNGNTEEAFNFYRTVFKTAFQGDGIHRLGDIPADAGHPPLSDADKKLILHVELPITGGHLLMGTDAPESMGFKLTQGNNMHISLEPETKEETKRLFDAISDGGNITMPLKDMFLGVYFGYFGELYG